MSVWGATLWRSWKAKSPCEAAVVMTSVSDKCAAEHAYQIGARVVPAGLTKLSGMRIKSCRIDQFFGKYEFTAKYLLSSSDAESRNIKELLELEPGAHERLLQQWCGYTESPGAPALREVISEIYPRIKSDDVLVLSAAEEGIFVLYHALVSRGDHVIVETPCYESALEVARSTGAQVSEWRRSFQNGWAHDPPALEKLLQPNTTLTSITTPPNPPLLSIPAGVFQEVIKLTARRGIILCCDEGFP